MFATGNVSDLTLAINIHRRLVQDFPSTPYILWCRWVHSSAFSCEQKLDRILSWALQPDEYTSGYLFQYDYYAFNLLRKFLPGGVLPPCAEMAALATFDAAEDQCRRINREFFSLGELPTPLSILERARKEVERILGPLSALFTQMDKACNGPSEDSVLSRHLVSITPSEFLTDSICSAPPLPMFGPGVSVSPIPGKGSGSIVEKVLFGTATPEVLAYCRKLQSCFRFGPATLVRGGHRVVVPKNRKTGRTICYEPSMNMLLQKMAGDFMKTRILSSTGVDLRDQTRNQTMALLGSISGTSATLDLSSASDLNSYALVYRLLPSDWFEYLDQIRCRRYFDGREWKEFEKFSTMGNGFTFELETILFYALVKASCETVLPSIDREAISAYGDDLIFPAQCYESVVSTLMSVGHTPNRAKSFATGPFRESCGGDFFLGHRVTPFYLKELSNERDAINLYNELFRLAGQVNPGRGLCSRFTRTLRYLENWLRSRIPGLSSGPVESRFVNSHLGWCLESSGRYLWSEEPIAEPTCVWVRHLQTFAPETLVLEAKDVTTEYDMSSLMSGYRCQYRIGPPTLSTSTIQVVRNPLLKRPRSRRSRNSVYQAQSSACLSVSFN